MKKQIYKLVVSFLSLFCGGEDKLAIETRDRMLDEAFDSMLAKKLKNKNLPPINKN